MAQQAIREYDAKRLWAFYSGQSYQGLLVETQQQKESVMQDVENFSPSALRVVKPDQLFGKRGKLGLVGVKLDAQGVQQWIDARRHQETMINGVNDRLHSFLIEPFVPHEEEYYISMTTERDADVIRFSALGGIDIEEQWESVHEIRVGVLDELHEDMIDTLFGKTPFLYTQDLSLSGEKIRVFIKQFFQFFREQGFVSLEVNPFVITPSNSYPKSTSSGAPLSGGEYDQLQVSCLDMVAKVDSCEAYRQKEREKHINRVKPFGTKQHPSEALVEEVDSKTGASLKLTIINPDGRLWFLLGGGGASVIVMDTLTQRGLMHELANYGELSGNPDEDSNRSYVITIIETMLANSNFDQYLCLIGGIANFTDIVSLVKPLTDALKIYATELRERRTTILMRRGGLRVEQAMRLLETTCKELELACVVPDDEQPLTKVLDEVKF